MKINFMQIYTKDIIVNPNQPRKDFDKDKHNELRESIKSIGLLEPLIVCQKGSKYQIIAGERRYRACRSLAFDKIPCIIRNEKNPNILSLSENLVRHDLNPIEEAVAINDVLIYYFNDAYTIILSKLEDHIKANKTLTENERKMVKILKTFGRTPERAEKIVKLLKLPESIRRLVIIGKIPLSYAIQISRLEGQTEIQESIGNKIEKNEINNIGSLMSCISIYLSKITETSDIPELNKMAINIHGIVKNLPRRTISFTDDLKEVMEFFYELSQFEKNQLVMSSQILSSSLKKMDFIYCQQVKNDMLKTLDESPKNNMTQSMNNIHISLKNLEAYILLESNTKYNDFLYEDAEKILAPLNGRTGDYLQCLKNKLLVENCVNPQNTNSRIWRLKKINFPLYIRKGKGNVPISVITDETYEKLKSNLVNNCEEAI